MLFLEVRDKNLPYQLLRIRPSSSSRRREKKKVSIYLNSKKSWLEGKLALIDDSMLILQERRLNISLASSRLTIMNWKPRLDTADVFSSFESLCFFSTNSFNPFYSFLTWGSFAHYYFIIFLLLTFFILFLSLLFFSEPQEGGWNFVYL